jgi:hypothetical protein
MSTRSNIIVKLGTGKWHRIYCHSDGYLEHNGRILFESYRSQARAEALVRLGDLSCIGPEIGKKHPFDWYAPLYERHAGDWDKIHADPDYIVYSNMCLAYGRDRGGKDVSGFITDTLGEALGDDVEEYVYVWADGAWRWSNSANEFDLRDLGETLVSEGILEVSGTQAQSSEVADIELGVKDQFYLACHRVLN